MLKSEQELKKHKANLEDQASLKWVSQRLMCMPNAMCCEQSQGVNGT